MVKNQRKVKVARTSHSSNKKNKQKRGISKIQKKNSVRRVQKRVRNSRTYSAPFALGSSVGSAKPKMSGNRVTHSEFIMDIHVDANEGNELYRGSIPINPGLSTTFPWLSKIAQAYESYNFIELSFKFINNVGASAQGMILLAPDYDCKDNNSSLTKRDLFSFLDRERGAIWRPLTMKCSPGKEGFNKRKTYYVRTNASTEQTRLDDALELIYLVDGVSESTLVGEIWVHYTVEFFTPQIQEITNPMMIITGSNSTTYTDIKSNMFESDYEIKTDTINVPGSSPADKDVAVGEDTGTKVMWINKVGKFLLKLYQMSKNLEDPTFARFNGVDLNDYIVQQPLAPPVPNLFTPVTGAVGNPGFEDNSAQSSLLDYEDEFLLDVNAVPLAFRIPGAKAVSANEWVESDGVVVLEEIGGKEYANLLARSTILSALRTKNRKLQPKRELKEEEDKPRVTTIYNVELVNAERQLLNIMKEIDDLKEMNGKITESKVSMDEKVRALAKNKARIKDLKQGKDKLCKEIDALKV